MDGSVPLKVWADFRKAVGNFSSARLYAALHLQADMDEEWTEDKFLLRWKAEAVRLSHSDTQSRYAVNLPNEGPMFQLGSFIVDTDVFITNHRTGGADLSKLVHPDNYFIVSFLLCNVFFSAHAHILETIWATEACYCLIRATSTTSSVKRAQYAQVWMDVSCCSPANDRFPGYPLDHWPAVAEAASGQEGELSGQGERSLC